MENTGNTNPTNFIRQIIDKDLAAGKNQGKVATRFPPEPNGYLHIGHARAICLNFGIAEDYNGGCNLRFDDTNPEKEEVEYAESIKQDVHWLGYEWANLCYASDYFEQLYQFALDLIRQGKAYVDSQSSDKIRETRGTLTEPGVESPCRARAVADQQPDHPQKYTDRPTECQQKRHAPSPARNPQQQAPYHEGSEHQGTPHHH